MLLCNAQCTLGIRKVEVAKLHCTFRPAPGGYGPCWRKRRLAGGATLHCSLSIRWRGGGCAVNHQFCQRINALHCSFSAGLPCILWAMLPDYTAILALAGVVRTRFATQVRCKPSIGQLTTVL